MASFPRIRSIGRAAVPVAALLLALALRMYAIDRQSLWYDEGLTAALVQRAPGEIVRAAAADIHPPLYYLLLHAWVALFGVSEAALRAPSAICGALTAALTAILGRRWFGPAAGAIAGLAAALAPLGVYYGQEARMYALAGLLAALLWLALDLWLASRRWRWLALYGLAALAALLTHYFMVTLVAAAGASGALALLAAPRGRGAAAPRSQALALAAFVALHLALAGVYLPLAWGSRAALAGWTVAKDAPPVAIVALDALRALALGPVAPPQTLPWLALAIVPLLGLALWPAGLRRRERAMAGAWLLTPLAALALLSLGQPYYKPRFLLPALPAFQILLGAGAVALAARLAAVARPRLTEWLLAGLIALGAAQPLAHTYADPAAWRDDYRGVARAISDTARVGDAVVLEGPGQVEPLGYYLRAPLARFPLPRARPLDPAATERALAEIAARHGRIYGVFYVPEEADPQGVVAGWLQRNTWPAGGRWYGGVRLNTYALGELAAPETPTDAAFGVVRLLAARAGPAALRPSDALLVETRWRADAPPGALLVFAHLLDAQGRIVAQYDGPPAAQPSEAWAVGQEQRGRLALIVPPDAPPGDYRLLLGLYDPATGARLTLPDGADSLELLRLTVGR